MQVRCIDCGTTLDAPEGRVGEAMRGAGWTMSGGAMLCSGCAGPDAAGTLAQRSSPAAYAGLVVGNSVGTSNAGPASPGSVGSEPRRLLQRGPLGALALAAVIAAIVAIVVALGGGGAPANLDPVAQAADSTLRAGGAEFTMSMRMTLPGSQAPFAMTASGYINEAKLQGTMSMHATSLPSNLPGGLSSSALNIDAVFDHYMYYMRSPALAGQLPGGKSWMRLDLGSMLKQRFGLSPSALQSGTTDPGQFLKMLKASRATVVGHSRVRGVSTTQYRGTIDLHAVADQLPADQRSAAKAGIGKLIAQLGGASTIPVDAWVDASNHLRRMHISLPLTLLGSTGAIDVTMDMFDFGVSRSISIPAAPDVYDATGLVARALPTG